MSPDPKPYSSKHQAAPEELKHQGMYDGQAEAAKYFVDKA